MNRHHRRFVLRQYIEHKNPENLRLHVWTHAIGWLALTTALSQIPLPVAVPVLGANLGAGFAVLSFLYWLPVDALVTAGVAALTIAWSLLPFSPWGPGHGWLTGVVVPLLVFTAMGFTRHFAHVYHHEHAEFLKGGPRFPSALLTIHSVIWGPFHFWLASLLHAGWRPRLKAELDLHERQALRSRQQVPWVNWAGIASCRAQFVCTPQTVEDLIDAVGEAHARGQRVRVVASGFSWSSLVPSDDTLIFCERLDRITVDMSDEAQPAVWAEAGVTNRQLNRELERFGLCMPWNVVLENVRVAGIVSTGTHGSGQVTATVGDLVDAFEVVDSEGRLRVLSDETVGAEVMSAARLGLGLFGVIARVKLRVVPIYRVCQADRRLPSRDVLDHLSELIHAHDSVELYWFPFNRDVWMRTVDRTDEPRTFHGHGFWFKTLNFLQNAWLVVFSKLVLRFAPALTPALLRIGIGMLPFRTRVLNLPESHHYHHWIEMMPCGCLEVGFKADPDSANIRRAWETAERLVDEYASRGLYPLNLTLNVRFIGSSGALLTPAYGNGLTCYVEIMWMGRSKGWVEFTSELCREWLKVPGAMPHWSKEFEHVPGVVPIMRASLGDRRGRFLDALAKSGLDPERGFWNALVRRVLIDEPPAS
jgi:FAD binding domain-containing protein/D-arabinono-1,4-lactone oxidase